LLLEVRRRLPYVIWHSSFPLGPITISLFS